MWHVKINWTFYATFYGTNGRQEGSFYAHYLSLKEETQEVELVQFNDDTQEHVVIELWEDGKLVHTG
jgi:hypothetical protein